MTETTEADPRSVVNRLIEDVINAHRPELADEVMDSQIVLRRMGMEKAAAFLASRAAASGGNLRDHASAPASPVEGFKAAFNAILTAFPDMRNNVVGPQVVDGDTVITHITFSGTHEGEFLGAAATHKVIEFDEILIQRVTDGKVSEVWALGDELGFLQQLGVLPTP
jgi:predicted ester cyclase